MNEKTVDSTDPADIDQLAVDLVHARGDDRAELLTAVAEHGSNRLLVELLARSLTSIDGLTGLPQNTDFEVLALRVTVAALTGDADVAKLALHDGAASVPGLLALVSELARQLTAAWVQLNGGDPEQTLQQLRWQLLRIEAGGDE